jgi:hypothetical protein
MAVALEFINFIVPISSIRQKYPGGWQRCLEDHGEVLGATVWHDAHLFRDGAMNGRDIEAIAKYWQSLGFKLRIKKRAAALQWADLCVVSAFAAAPTLPCPWIEIDATRQCAFLKGAEPGAIVGRSIFE